MYTEIDVGSKDHGNLWNRKPIPYKDDGGFLYVTHSHEGKRPVRFLHAAIDTTSDRVLVADHQGNVFLINLEQNRYEMICKTGWSITAIAWNDYRVNEFIVALTNCELRCYNVVEKGLVNVMRSHSSPIHSLSLHASGCYALSSSFQTTVLWDLNMFMKCRTLNGAQSVGVQQVFFLPNSSQILSCFKDDSVFVWDSETMKCQFQLHARVGDTKPSFRCLAVTDDCRVLVAGGKSRFIHVWNLDSRQLIQVIELPEKVKEVKSLSFVQDKMAVNQLQLLAILTQDGILRFIDPHLCKLQAEIGCQEQRIYEFKMSSDGRLLVAILDNGSILFHKLSTVLQHLDQGLQPIVRKLKTVEDAKEEDLKQKLIVESNETSSTSATTAQTEESIYKDLPDGLNMKKLRKILRGFGEYPAKYRLFIWRSILRLPENHVSFSVLADKGTHSAFANLHEKFPIKSRKLFRVLQRVLSALAYWSPIFGETEYLPLMVFPVVKLFPNNQLVCFEIAATLLLNWCEKWFEYFPNPPLNILNMIESLLAHHDKPLLDFFIGRDVSSQEYAWPMLYTLFSEVLTAREWMVVWDNLFSCHPSMLVYLAIAYLIKSRQALFSTKTKSDVEFFFHHRNAVEIHSVVKEMYRLSSITPPDLDPKKMLTSFTPLPTLQYPVFDSYPKFVVDYLVEERERIREEELEYLRQKQLALEVKKQKEQTKREEIAFYREQEQMIKAEEERRQLISKEEEKLVEKRKKLMEMRRELALEELGAHDQVRRRFLRHQRTQKGVEMQRLDDELNRKIIQRENECQAVLQNAEVKGLEIEARNRRFQQELIHQEVDTTFHLRAKENILRQRQNNADQKFRHLAQQTADVDTQEIRKLQTELASLQVDQQNRGLAEEMLSKDRMQDDHRDHKFLQIAEKSEDLQRKADNFRQTIQQKIDIENKENEGEEEFSRGSFSVKQHQMMDSVKRMRLKMAQRSNKQQKLSTP